MEEDELTYLKYKFKCDIEKTSSKYRITCRICRHYYNSSANKLHSILEKSVGGCICKYECHKSIDYKLLDEFDNYGKYIFSANTNRLLCLKCNTEGISKYYYEGKLLQPICKCNIINLSIYHKKDFIHDNIAYRIEVSYNGLSLYLYNQYMYYIDAKHILALSIFQKRTFKDVLYDHIRNIIKIEKDKQNN